MVDQIVSYLEAYQTYAIIISLLISIVVAVSGVIPTFFVTAANIIFFGFWTGTLISFFGEALGAIVAFYLYRKGFRRISEKQLHKFPRVKALVQTTGKEAAYLILALRILPFMPSVIVTFAAAIGKVSFGLFAWVSTLGKIPALLIEAYSVYQVTQFTWQGKLILVLSSLYLFYWVWKKKNKD